MNNLMAFEVKSANKLDVMAEESVENTRRIEFGY